MDWGSWRLVAMTPSRIDPVNQEDEMTTEDMDLSSVDSRNKRPIKNEDIRRQAAAEIIDHLIKQDILSADERAESIEDLVKATRYETDAYKIARELDDRSHHWEIDMSIVEELEAFDGIFERIYEEVEKRWAAENPHDPLFADGDTVMWRGEPATIHGLSTFRPQAYRVRQGVMSNQTGYYIVPFEDVSAVPEA